MSTARVLLETDAVSDTSPVVGIVFHVTPVSVQLPPQGRTVYVYVPVSDAYLIAKCSFAERIRAPDVIP